MDSKRRRTILDSNAYSHCNTGGESYPDAEAAGNSSGSAVGAGSQ